MTISCVTGSSLGPMTPGSAYVMAHHAICSVGESKGCWGWVRGGMGAITQALLQAAKRHGVTVCPNAEVSRIVIEDGSAVGVKLQDGRLMNSRIIVSNADIIRTVTKQNTANPPRSPTSTVSFSQFMNLKLLRTRCILFQSLPSILPTDFASREEAGMTLARNMQTR